ncbi:MAG TPA: hypothetical protein VGJ74_10560 [Burkholderiales bacterium]
MSSWHRSSARIALAALLASAPAWADQTIEITALRQPVDKSYRKMVQGMELFDERHALAPNATLRYRLLPRKRDTNMEAIALQIVGERFKRPVAVAADHTFTLTRYQQALDEDAVVRSERKAQTMTWRAEIRTPGSPPDTRRLGDLRLECLVGMQAGLVSRYPSVIGRFFDLVLDAADFCNRSYAPYLFFAERPLFAVTLADGARRQVLSVGQLYAGMAHGRTTKADLPHCDCEALLDRAYILPLGDKSWPDHTLVEFEYMDAAASDGIAIGGSKADVAAAFGKAALVRFDSGYEVWAYQSDRPEPPFGRSEFVVLFSPSGVVSNTRLRPAP